MKKGGIGILVFRIVALLVAFLAMKAMQNPAGLTEKLEEKAENAVQQAADTVADAIQNIDLGGAVQNSGLLETLQDAFSKIGGA